MALHPRKLIAYGLAGWLPGGGRRCVVCERRVWRFMPYRGGMREVRPLMQALAMVGSDVEQFECPRCGAHDRERHLFLYMKASGVFANIAGASILHFAPEKRLSPIIAAQGPAQHVRCDLYPESPDIQRVDIQAIPFAAESFDLVLANHVLEHVSSPDDALAEVRRVLKPGGYAILQTPYASKLQRTWEDPGIDTPQARLHGHGQEDHLRLFGRDIFDRIVAAGMESQVHCHADLLGEVDAAIAGVNAAEPFFLFRKPAERHLNSGTP